MIHAGALIGYFFGRRLALWERALLGLAAIMLVAVGQMSNVFGLALLAAVVIRNKASRKAAFALFSRNKAKHRTRSQTA